MIFQYLTRQANTSRLQMGTEKKKTKFESPLRQPNIGAMGYSSLME